MSVFKRTATVAYDGRNFSILGVEYISSPKPAEIIVDDFRLAYSIGLSSSGSGSSDTTVQTDALLYDFGWALRLFQDEFPTNKQSPENLLQGFLVVPIQFSTTMWQFLNTTLTEVPGLFALPYDLQTTASAAQPTYRALAAPWTVFLYMIIAGVSVLWASLLFLCSVCRNPVVPNTSSFAEIDISSKPIRLPNEINELGVMDYSSMLRTAGLGNAISNAIVVAIKDHRIRVAEWMDLSTNRNVLVLVTMAENSESWKNISQLRDIARDRDYL